MNTPLQAGVKTMSAASGLLAEVINAFSEKLTLTSFGVVALVLGSVLLYRKSFPPQLPPQKVTIDLTVPVAHPSTPAPACPTKAIK